MTTATSEHIPTRPRSSTYYREGVGYVTDPGADEIREKRKQNEAELRENLGETFGKSAAERMEIIRAKIMDGIPDVHGYDITESRRERATAGNFEFLPAARIDSALENYFQLLDEAYEQVKAEVKQSYAEKFQNYQEHSKEMVLRLCGVMYSIGILIHRYPDGNGQTLRLLLQSYSDELIGDQGSLVFEERNVAEKKGNVASGITTDLIMHLYNVFADFQNLRNPAYRELVYIFKIIEDCPTLLPESDNQPDADNEYYQSRIDDLKKFVAEIEIYLKDSRIMQDVRDIMQGSRAGLTYNEKLREILFVLREEQQYLSKRMDRMMQRADRASADFSSKLDHLFDYLESDVARDNILGFIKYEEYNKLGDWTPASQSLLENSVHIVKSQLEERWVPKS